MAPIKVAHVATLDSFLKIFLLDQMRSMRDAGYEVAGISCAGPDVAALEAAGIRHIPVEMTRNITPFADLVALGKLVGVLRRERFTIVHTHNPKPGLLGQLAARLAGVPVVINTLHGLYFHENMHPLKRRFYVETERLAGRCSDRILSQNREDIDTVLREGIAPPDRVAELGNGINLSAFDPARFTAEDVRQRKQEVGIPPDAPVVGFVGRLAAKRKGFLDFLRAGERVAERLPGVRFLIVGEADHGKPDAVEPEQARQFRIWPACHFLGTRPNRELPCLYALMDLLVLPSIFEGLPRVIMEASAMARPTVATNVKGNREAVEHGRTGALVPYGDVAALADAILRFLTNPTEARETGTRAREMALNRFDERRVFEKVLQEYSRLLERKGSPVPRRLQPA